MHTSRMFVEDNAGRLYYGSHDSFLNGSWQPGTVPITLYDVSEIVDDEYTSAVKAAGHGPSAFPHATRSLRVGHVAFYAPHLVVHVSDPAVAKAWDML